MSRSKFKYETLLSQRVGGVRIELEKISSKTTDYVSYLLTEVDSSGEPIEYYPEDEAEGRRWFADSVKQYSGEPDWELQAQYDEMHGTINGRDPGVVLMEELTRG